MTITGPVAVHGMLQSVFAGLRVLEGELMLFAAFWFVVGILDELAIDLAWLWLRLRGLRTHRMAEDVVERPLSGIMAVFIPAWQEAEVIGATVCHALKAWPQDKLRLYVGCYRNDVQTILATMAGAGIDPRVRLVIHAAEGPTTKADCLNRLYDALCEDERRSGVAVRGVVLHDAEDMVHPAALPLMDLALADADFVQIPVRPEPQPGGLWIAGHYGDEFSEAHAKAMVVRDALGAALPAAGVGCALGRGVLAELTARRKAAGGVGPFEAACLTEDYELGWLVSRAGRRSRFLRLRDSSGALIATRSYFPAEIYGAVRQKTRWVHGIAFQGWERLGWSGRAVDIWMALRDRRGPLVALVLAVAYALLLLAPVMALGRALGLVKPAAPSPALDMMLGLCLAGLAWRVAMRFAFTSREYGLAQGVVSIFRIPVANVIAIMAGRRAFAAYCRSLRGVPVAWDKTTHLVHPARDGLVPSQRAAA